FSRHPRTTIIWAHAGLGRVVAPINNRISTAYENPIGICQIEIVDRALSNPALAHVNIDLSWDETAKYILKTPESLTATVDLINRHPDRFVFGTDEVAPTEQAAYLKVYSMYAPLFARLTPDASEKLRKKNYERLFDAARRNVRAWEHAHA